MKTQATGRPDEKLTKEEFFVASSWKLMAYKFTKHKVAVAGTSVLGFLYLFVIFSGFFSSNGIYERHKDYMYLPPQRVHLIHNGRLQVPFVYGIKTTVDRVNYRLLFEVDKTQRFPLRFFSRGYEYKFLGLFKANIHLVGVEEPGVFFPFGTDGLGRCQSGHPPPMPGGWGAHRPGGSQQRSL